MSASISIAGGLVILFEGLDGVGKTTQLGLAAEALKVQGYRVTTSRNLGGTPIGEALRTVVLSDVERSAMTDLYISVAIQTALAEDLQRKRQTGQIVLVDRGPLSMAAYHIYGNGADADVGWRYVAAGMSSFRPELVLLFEAPVETALGRARQHSAKADYYESQPLAYFERVSQGYAAAAQRYPVTKLDARPSIETIHTSVMELISEAIAAKQSAEPRRKRL